MSAFDQKGQQVNNQINIAGNVDFKAVQTKQDFNEKLSMLETQVKHFIDEGSVEGEASIDLKSDIEKAKLESSKPEPSKEKITGYLQKALTVAKSVTALAALAKGIQGAIEAVQKTF